MRTSKSRSVSAIEKGNGEAAVGMSSDARMVNAAVEIEGCHHGLGDLGDEVLREEQNNSKTTAKKKQNNRKI